MIARETQNAERALLGLCFVSLKLYICNGLTVKAHALMIDAGASGVNLKTTLVIRAWQVFHLASARELLSRPLRRKLLLDRFVKWQVRHSHP